MYNIIFHKPTIVISKEDKEAIKTLIILTDKVTQNLSENSNEPSLALLESIDSDLIPYTELVKNSFDDCYLSDIIKELHNGLIALNNICVSELDTVCSEES